jgi:hypothetical protein
MKKKKEVIRKDDESAYSYLKRLKDKMRNRKKVKAKE